MDTVYTAGPHQNRPHPPSDAPCGPRPGRSIVPSSLDSSLEKTILGFFFETRCWVFGCRGAVRRGLGVTKSPSDEAAEARCWCRLETRKGRDTSPQKRNLWEKGLVCPPWGCLTYQWMVSWLMGLSGCPLGQSQDLLLRPSLWCGRPEASVQTHLL